MEDVSLFCVFDGHGGKSVSAAVAARFAEHMRSGLEEYVAKHGGGMTQVDTIKAALPDLFVSLDKDLHSQVMAGTLEESGTTAVTVFLTPTHIICANSGDSRAILVTGGKVEKLSDDHKPSNPMERDRIYAAGGLVSMERVDGDLAVSRAFGDFRYKEAPGVEWKKQKVSVEPDFTIYPRRPSQDEFVIVACDGIWDVFSNDEVGMKTRALAKFGADECTIAEFLIDDALVRNSRDNMSVICVRMEAAVKPTLAVKEAMAKAKAEANKQRDRLSERGEPVDAAAAYLRLVASACTPSSSDEDDAEDDAEASKAAAAAPAGSGSGSSSSSLPKGASDDESDEDGGPGSTATAAASSSSSSAATSD